MYQHHAPWIRQMLTRLLGPTGDADDVTQEVFLVAWRKLHTFEGDDLRPWLCTIALKLASAARRRARIRRLFGLGGADERLEWRTPERLAEQTEARRQVYEVLDRIPERRRTAFVLFELQGLSGQEIAAIMGCPLKTVWTRIYRARRQFVAEVAALKAPGRATGGESRRG